eukprot:30737-Rhodomonas_salina.2
MMIMIVVTVMQRGPSVTWCKGQTRGAAGCWWQIYGGVMAAVAAVQSVELRTQTMAPRLRV